MITKNLFRTTGCAIKNGTHCFNQTYSQDRNVCNFKTTFICYYTELSFEVYDAFLGQLAQKWGVVKAQSLKQIDLKKVHFISLIGNNFEFSAIYLDLELSKHTNVGVSAKNHAAASSKLAKKIKL